jgi:CheY-like chemotaxis protein
MTVRVLVVDDSGFFRRRMVEILNADPGIEVVGHRGQWAGGHEQALKLKPDVITMDIEMPVMDGITAVRRIMARHPVPVLMFSSLTHRGRPGHPGCAGRRGGRFPAQALRGHRPGSGGGPERYCAAGCVPWVCAMRAAGRSGRPLPQDPARIAAPARAARASRPVRMPRPPAASGCARISGSC